MRQSSAQQAPRGQFASSSTQQTPRGQFASSSSQQAPRAPFARSFATAAARNDSPSVKGMLSDILLLSFWVAMIPAVLLIGNAAGY
ncbi:MAG: hypothetical protein QE486_08110 [Burkholderiaceae bacterium]|nr:hypothetical protein [Burkholderiaceae bacterium]